MKLFVAPLQGHTDAVFRHFHASIYGNGADAYFSPFMRVEKGEVRKKDIHDVTSALNSNHTLLPQIIFRDANEYEILLSALMECGLSDVDLNMGCPFPPQVNHGRGAAMLRKPECLREVRSLMERHPEIRFSAKMRLGIQSPDDWRGMIDILNDMPLTHITVHPRVTVQQYGGDLHLDEFEKLLGASAHPVVFNGNLSTPDDMAGIIERFPKLSGLMIGRGLLGRPSIFEEFRSGEEWERPRRIAHILELHRQIFLHYRQILCGDTQLLMKIKPFWDYLEPEIGHKAAKAIRKATTVSKYDSAISQIEL